MDFQLVSGGPDVADLLVFTTSFSHNNISYKAALAETISWGGQLTGTYDALLQSGRGTQRLTLSSIVARTIMRGSAVGRAAGPGGV